MKVLKFDLTAQVIHVVRTAIERTGEVNLEKEADFVDVNTEPPPPQTLYTQDETFRFMPRLYYERLNINSEKPEGLMQPASLLSVLPPFILPCADYAQIVVSPRSEEQKHRKPLNDTPSWLSFPSCLDFDRCQS